MFEHVGNVDVCLGGGLLQVQNEPEELVVDGVELGHVLREVDVQHMEILLQHHDLLVGYLFAGDGEHSAHEFAEVVLAVDTRIDEAVLHGQRRQLLRQYRFVFRRHFLAG